MRLNKGTVWFVVLGLLIAVAGPAVSRTATLDVTLNEDAMYTKTAEVAVQVAYTGNKVPTEMRVYPTGNGEWSEWFDYREAFDWMLPGVDGPATLKIETRYWVESKTDETTYSGWRVVAGQDAIFVDLTAPVLTVSLPDANEHGWYNAPVLVTFAAEDAGSGLAVGPEDVTLSGEGAGQSVTGTAVDKAGNETQIVVGDIHIDLTAPVLTVSVPDANEHGWYNAPVSITFAAEDTGSGLAVEPSSTTLSGEGAGQSATGTAVDKAGNEAQIVVGDIHIDLTAPVLTVSVPDANENGWYTVSVPVDYSASDALSGLASVPEDRTFDVTGIVTLFPRAMDKAGNEAQLADVVLKIDVDKPSIAVEAVNPGASADVWVPGPVEVSFSASDDFSGVAGIEYVEGAATNAVDGGHQTVTGQATDTAGNVSDPASVTHINVDGALPTTTILLVDSEGTTVSNTAIAVPTLDLKAKLDAFGTYDPADVALGYAFMDAAGAPITGLNAYATILEVAEDGSVSDIQFFRICSYAPTGGFYFFVLPDELISGEEYEVWFEESEEGDVFKTRIVAL